MDILNPGPPRKSGDFADTVSISGLILQIYLPTVCIQYKQAETLSIGFLPPTHQKSKTLHSAAFGV